MDWNALSERLKAYDVTLATLAGVSLTLSSVLKLLLLFALLWWAAGRLRRLVVEHALTHTHLDAGTRQIVGSFVRYLVLVVGVVLILQNVGLNLSALGVGAWLSGFVATRRSVLMYSGAVAGRSRREKSVRRTSRRSFPARAAMISQ